MIENLKISFFLPNLNGGGAERVIVMLANAAAQRGYDVELVVGSDTGPYREEVAPAVLLVNLRQPRTLLCLPALTRYLILRRPHCAVSTLMRANVVLLLAASLVRGTRVVVREASMSVDFRRAAKKGLTEKLLPWLARVMYPRAHCVVAVSEDTREFINRLIGKATLPVAVIPNPISVADAHAKSLAPVDHQWFTLEHEVVLGVGRFEAEKNFQLLIRAFSEVAKVRPKARLVLLGQGSQRAELERLAMDLGVREKVDFPGFQVNPFPFFRAADVFVLSSLTEGFPNVLAQALAVGTPVVATSCCSSVREILRHGDFGRLTNPSSSTELTAAILDTLNSGLRTDAATLAEHLSRFEVDKVVDTYLQVVLGLPTK
jgi:glycosyltransferase involved in cell wall biosynthesis